MDDIAYMISYQPLFVTWILIMVSAILFEVVIDFLCAIFIPGWFSPCGWKTRKKGSHDKNQTR